MSLLGYESADAEDRRHFRAKGTGDVEWYTPQIYIEAARQVLGGIDLDPASCEFAQRRVKASTFYTKEDDGLAHEWHGRVWLNPPYAKGLMGRFVGKLTQEIQARRVTAAILLTHNSTDTAWFHEATQTLRTICFTRGRVQFEKDDGEHTTPTQGQAFHYFGPRADVFHEVFGKYGIVRRVFECFVDSQQSLGLRVTATVTARPCAHCGLPIYVKRADARYCRDACRQAAHRGRRK